MNKLDKKSILGISALLVHAANIDEIYSDHEKELTLHPWLFLHLFQQNHIF